MIHCRILAKTLLWRVISSGTTVLITFLVTKDVAAGLKVGSIDMVVASILYYLYEWVWQKRCTPQQKNELQQEPLLAQSDSTIE